MSPVVAILVPVLRRPHRVRPLLDSIEASTPAPHRVVFICDPGDTDEIQAIRQDGRAGAPLCVDGNYATKINVAARLTGEPLLFTGADDLHFHPGWLEAARARLRGGIAVVGTNDLGNQRVLAGNHSTHSLVARWYLEIGTIDEPGKLLHEGYEHEFVDDEFVQTAQHRGVYAHAHDSVVEHLHPLWNKAPTDPIYDAHAERMRAGRKLYQRRMHLWAT